MAIKRVTVSLPDDLASRLKSEAGDRSVSAYVAELIYEHLVEAEAGRLWQEYVAEAAVSADDVAAADEILDELRAQQAPDAA